MLDTAMDFIKSNWSWLLGVFIVLFIIIRVKIRKYFWKVKKTGEKLKFKEFFKLWKKGVNGIAALQTAKSQVLGNIIVIIGVVSGIIINLIIRIENQWWWVCIILVGSLILTGLSQVSYLQKYWRLKQIDEAIREMEKKDEV